MINTATFPFSPSDSEKPLFPSACLDVPNLVSLRRPTEEKEKKGVRNRLKTVTGNIETHERKMGKAKEAWAIYELYNLKLKQNNFIEV
jgi:hypothetical protein